MSKRITQAQLEAVVERINVMTGSPMITWVKDEGGKYTSQIGNYHLSYAYGGVSLHRICSSGGGVSDVFRCGHVSKRELLNLLFAYIEGLSARNQGGAL